MRKSILLTTVAVLGLGLSAPAMAFMGGGSGGPNFDSTNYSASGEVFSGSGNDFGVSGDFDDIGGIAGGMSSHGYNSGSATVGASFDGASFDGYATSENIGGLDSHNYGAGAGGNLDFDFSASSFGESFGSAEWGFDGEFGGLDF